MFNRFKPVVMIGFVLIVGIAAVLKILVLPYIGVGQESARLPVGERIANNLPDLEIPTSDNSPVNYLVEEVATNLFVPWDIEFTSNQRMLVTERNGRVRIVENGQLQQQPLHHFSQVSTTGEEGLMGMAVDPDYENNKQLYFCLAYPKNGQLVDKVVRLTDQGNQLTNEQIVIDDLPAARFHAGCRIKFGPDKKLYITVGDATDRQIAQDMNSLGGKILRVNSDGSNPSDNPFPNSPIYSLGHRNPQGIDWHPITQVLFATEHGPSGFDGRGGGDEVNIIEAGKNYGWPIVSHDQSQEGMVDPLIEFTPAEAPASGLFYTDDVFPQFTNTFLFGALRGEGIIQLEVTDEAPHQLLAHLKIEGIELGRIREVEQGPDGLIYFSSSNQDGRGNSLAGDDKIYRLVPQE